MKKVICLLFVLCGTINLRAEEALTPKQWEEKVVYVAKELAGHYLLNCTDTLDQKLGKDILQMQVNSYVEISQYLDQNKGGGTLRDIFKKYYNNKINSESKTIDILLDIECISQKNRCILQSTIDDLRNNTDWYNDKRGEQSNENLDAIVSLQAEWKKTIEELNSKCVSIENKYDMSKLCIIIVALIYLSIVISLIFFIVRLKNDVKYIKKQNTQPLSDVITKELITHKLGLNDDLKDIIKIVYTLKSEVSSLIQKKEGQIAYATKGELSSIEVKINKIDKDLCELRKNIQTCNEKNNSISETTSSTSISNSCISNQPLSEQSTAPAKHPSSTLIVKHTGKGRLKECSKDNPEALFKLEIYDKNQLAELSYCGGVERAKTNPDNIFDSTELGTPKMI